MIPVMIFISCLCDSVNEFVGGGGGSKFWRARPASIIFISLSDHTAVLEQRNIRGDGGCVCSGFIGHVLGETFSN